MLPFRPQLLLLLSTQWSKETVDVRYLNLLYLASQLKAGRGLSIVVSLNRGDPMSVDERKKAEKVWFFECLYILVSFSP